MKFVAVYLCCGLPLTEFQMLWSKSYDCVAARAAACYLYPVRRSTRTFRLFLDALSPADAIFSVPWKSCMAHALKLLRTIYFIYLFYFLFFILIIDINN